MAVNALLLIFPYLFLAKKLTDFEMLTWQTDVKSRLFKHWCVSELSQNTFVLEIASYSPMDVHTTTRQKDMTMISVIIGDRYMSPMTTPMLCSSNAVPAPMRVA